MANLDKFGVPIPNDGRRQMGYPKPKNKFRVLLFGFGADDSWGDDGIAIAYETNTVSLPKFTVATHELHQFDGISNIAGKQRWNSMNLEVKDTIDNAPARAIFKQIQRHKDFNRRIAPKVNRGKYKFEMWIQLLGGEDKPGSVSSIDKLANQALELQAKANDVLEIANESNSIVENASSIWDTISGAKSMNIFTIADAVIDTAQILDSVDAIEDTVDNFGGTVSKIKADLFAGTAATWVCTGCLMQEVDFGELDYSTAEMNTISMSIIPDNCIPVDQNGNSFAFVPGSAGATGQGEYTSEIVGDINTAVGIVETGIDILGTVGDVAETATNFWNTASGIISEGDPTTSVTQFFGGLF